MGTADVTSAVGLPTQTTLARACLAAIRIGLGLLWIQNVVWKIPPDFDTLRHFTGFAVEYPVLAPYSYLVEEMVLPNMTAFGYGVLLVEASLGAFLTIGFATRFWALVGLGQTVAIALSVLNGPHEWNWSYYLMGMTHLAVFATAAGRAFGLDGVLREGWRDAPGRLARLLWVAS